MKIARGLELPLEAATQTFAILAVRGAGKTYTGAVIAEEMISAGIPLVVADPIGVWWGLRSEYPVAILGGDHGDVPLESTAGELIANWIVKNRRPCVLDMSLFRKSEQVRFMTAFAETLYRKNREPLHIILDEADTFAPQKPGRDQHRMLGALEDLVKKGRARGIGATMITQRAAVLNKNVLTQIEALICLRTTSPQDRKAVEAWIEANATDEDRDQFLADLPKLPIGHAWFWSPGWLQKFKRIAIRRRKSFDSSATPKMGRKLAPPKRMAKIELDQLHEQMTETIERAQKENPKRLLARVEHLENELAKAQRAQKPVEVPVLKDNQLSDLLMAADKIDCAQQSLTRCVQQLRLGIISTKPEQTIPEKSVPRRNAKPIFESRAHHRNSPSSRTPNPIAGGEQKILIALAQYPRGRTKIQIAILTGYNHKGGGFNNYLSSLRSRALIEGRGHMSITPAGSAELGHHYKPLPTGAALRDYWLRKLGKAERKILEVLCEAGQFTLTKEAIAEQAGYQPNGGGFNNALSKLRTLELISGRGTLTASESLFDPDE